jgi:nucleotide sugar dehydrogenase
LEAKIKIGIIGHGFVGKATEDGFSINSEKKIIDPKYGSNISELDSFNPDFIFICVPTPMSEDGSQDLSIINEVFESLKGKFKNSILILKSTILPDFLYFYSSDFQNLVYNPEFLRESFASEDFINSQMILLGGEKTNLEKVKLLYQNHSKCKTNNFIFTDFQTASLVKYTINTFLATKVLFFNQINSIFNKSGSRESWSKFIDIVSQDKRIGTSHMQVPGPDGRRGFGGACFTKDTAALSSYSRVNKTEINLIESIIKINNLIRKSYNELDAREREQNVNYEDI